MKHFNFGLIAEYLTILFYKLQFYQILGHRVRFYGGEIDIIAVRGKQVVFIEVKARSSDLDDILVRISQQKRITRAAETFLSRNPKYSGHLVRFDLSIVKPYKLPRIIKNAW